MRLSHFSDKIVRRVKTVKQRSEPHFKPVGFWVSVDGEDDWEWWCEGEQYPIGAVRHHVTLSPFANLLRICGVSELDCFHEEYGKDVDWGLSWDRKYPDWQLVASRYDGIVIAPYLWERRLDGEAHDWYYPWDCASGCIWNAKAIASVVAEQVKAA